MRVTTVIADIIQIVNRDHSDLQSLVAPADDHTQYLTDARAAVLHYTKTLVNTWRAAVTVTEMGYLHGLTSDLQTQLGTKVEIGGDLGGTISAPTVTDLTISSEARGDILIRGATVWIRLAPGTSGKVLQTKGAGANPEWSDAPMGVYSVGDVLLIEDTSGSTNSESTYTKRSEFRVGLIAGTIRVKFTLGPSGFVEGDVVYGRIYKNGAAIGTERTRNTSGSDVWSEDLSGFLPGDLIQLYTKVVGAGNVLWDDFGLYANAKVSPELV